MQAQSARTGLIVRGHPSFEEWERCGAMLRVIEGAVQFWIGDWINYGEHAYGEKYSQALEATGYEQRTLENCAFVVKNIHVTRRRVNVSFSVHSEVARLPTAVSQDHWLTRAADEQMTVNELRTALRLERRQQHYASGDLPEGRYRVIYADPPWQYDDRGDEGLFRRADRRRVPPPPATVLATGV